MKRFAALIVVLAFGFATVARQAASPPQGETGQGPSAPPAQAGRQIYYGAASFTFSARASGVLASRKTRSFSAEGAATRSTAIDSGFTVAMAQDSEKLRGNALANEGN